MNYYLGVDIGSTTVKAVVLDEDKNLIFKDYKRHFANTRETFLELLCDIKETLGDIAVRSKITGSGSINLANTLGIGFIQEVVAVANALEDKYPDVDVSIELGGEDAKIIYFDNGLEERMNGVCAGGTGAFIDQMASLLNLDAQGLNQEAKSYKIIYPIAARCGVFAKTDIQPLINDGAKKSDLAASIFQSVVNQTISGLACGKPIRGRIAFLGGPLHFLTELKKAFIRTLNITDENIIDPDDSHLYASIGSALEAKEENEYLLSDLIEKLNLNTKANFEIKRLEPLFNNENEYDEFIKRHEKAVVLKGDISTYEGECFLGIDAGSTTTKMAVVSSDGKLLFSHYSNNEANPIKTAIGAIKILKEKINPNAKIVRSCSTGYGESLLKSAFCLDEGEVETVCHATGASFFEPKLDCVLDIGGQDMKCIKLKKGSIDTVLLNEACSSGCGSFIESFANSLSYNVSDFAKEALFSKNPVDLGTRCTVFMNSNVKQAQKEGAKVSDISAGLAYSVIKNALFKVIKLADSKDLGKNIVVQGGTFHNKAVLRAFEKIAGVNAVCPDISGIMGAFGAALVAKNTYKGQHSKMLSLDDIINLSYKSSTVRCRGCTNKCTLTVNEFSNNRKYISGNRCEKGLGKEDTNTKAPNMVDYKMQRIFDYKVLDPQDAPRGVIGIPRVLNMYENYPFWVTFFNELGFSVCLSPFSTRKIYELGMESIPSESECYGAKLAHGHIEWLLNEGVKTIFHPCVFYEKKENKKAQNNFNCPIVVSYSENLKNNVERVNEKDINYVRPFIAFTSKKTVLKRLISLCQKEWNIPKSEVKKAVGKAWDEMKKVKADIHKKAEENLLKMREQGKEGIVLAMRPYHIDPEINHGIPELISSYGFYVFTEDSLNHMAKKDRPIRVVDQWVYHSRLYDSAEVVSKSDDLELIQLNSFGCGLDAVTTDQVSEILENANKLYTLLKIDEVNNLGAARIRIRSLISAIKMRKEKGIKRINSDIRYKRSEFTKDMFKDKFTILAPEMSKIHFSILKPIFIKNGFNLVILENDNKDIIDKGLKYVNNDACYPSILTVGQIMDAILSGNYDTDRLAVIMTQTGGCCRASNYVSFIRRALDKASLSHIPVISLNLNQMEKNSGFKLTLPLLYSAVRGLVIGDLLMKCLYATRPYEKEKGKCNLLYEKWVEISSDFFTNKKTVFTYKGICEGIVNDFDNVELYEDMKKPKVGIVGEILVKYMPLANNHLVDLLENEGAEAVVPDMVDFFNYCFFNGKYKHEFLGGGFKLKLLGVFGPKFVNKIRKPSIDAVKRSKRFNVSMDIETMAEHTKEIISLGNQYGEGWFLTGEMIELLHSGVNNIVCIQPFACLPNHVVGKGVIKSLKKHYKDANIACVDYDPGASEVNQLNRIKLMLSTAKKNVKKEETKEKELQKV